jgi:hypothetical protein
MFLIIRVRPVRKADNLTTICHPTVQTMWNPKQASTACYGDSFTYSVSFLIICFFLSFLFCVFLSVFLSFFLSDEVIKYRDESDL